MTRGPERLDLAAMTEPTPTIRICAECLVEFHETDVGRRAHLDVFGHWPVSR